MDDEWCFSSFLFLKSTLQNALDPHLYFIMGMYSQKIYILQKNSYDVAYAHWAIAGKYGRYGFNS
jgi:hypothetical protein